jgi:hypothetical protein
MSAVGTPEDGAAKLARGKVLHELVEPQLKFFLSTTSQNLPLEDIYWTIYLKVLENSEMCDENDPNICQTLGEYSEGKGYGYIPYVTIVPDGGGGTYTIVTAALRYDTTAFIWYEPRLVVYHTTEDGVVAARDTGLHAAESYGTETPEDTDPSAMLKLVKNALIEANNTLQ